EASLLFEAGSESEYDRVQLVMAPLEQRLRRWIEKGGSEADGRRRIAAQLPPEEAARRAHEILVNGGSPEELRRQVDEVWARWMTLAGN
ncbi:MAG TPA: dephospho-CoA kinase, partial [Thermoanaerobaculia bacterium]